MSAGDKEIAAASDGPTGRVSSPPPATAPRRASPAAARPSTPPPAEVAAPPPLESTPIVPAVPERVTPTAAALPPLTFSAQTVLVDGGRPRQRDTSVRVADGAVTVAGSDTKVVTAVPFDAVVGFTYSKSKQPLWNSPLGPSEIVHLDGGAFGFLKGDQHWVSLRTDTMSLVLRVREQDSQRIIVGLEERLGKRVERVSDEK